MNSKNRVCEILGIEKPVIQAAMTWITNAKMVAAVSEAGGAGVLGWNAGNTVTTSDPIETAERLRQQIREVRSLTDKPFGVNVMAGAEVDEFTKATLDVFETDKPDFVLFLPREPVNPDVIKKFKELDIKIVSRPLDSTIENLVAAQEEGADILICTGFEEGGHTPHQHVSLLSRLPAVKEKISIPIIAAGGIVNEASAKAAMALGAEGVYVGTRFIVSEECPAAMNVKQKIIDASADELIIIPAFPGFLHLIPSDLSKELKKMADEGAERKDITGHYSALGAFNEGMLKGNPDVELITCSEAIDSITSIKSCKEIVDELNVFKNRVE